MVHVSLLYSIGGILLTMKNEATLGLSSDIGGK
jgi:hypothetical protein